MLVDLQAFPFVSQELPAKLVFDSGNALDISIAPCAPPAARSFEEIDTELEWLKKQLAMQRHAVQVVLTKNHLYGCIPRILWGLQHPPVHFPANHMIFCCEWLKKHGVHFSSLTYDGTNVYGGGFHANGTSLTSSGKFYLDAMDRAKMCLDLSHAGNHTAREALHHIQYDAKLRNIRVMIAHSGCFRADNRQPCRFDDDVLFAIAEQGGIIGIPVAAFPCSSRDNEMDTVVDYISYVMDVVGPRAVAIGSAGTCQQHPDRKAPDPANSLTSNQTYGQTSVSNTRTRMQALREALERRHFHSSVIEAVLGKNAFNFLENIIA